MLGISDFLSSAVLLGSVVGAPLEPLEFPQSDTSLVGPYHGEPSMTYAVASTASTAASSGYSNSIPSGTAEGGQFFAQTTMPTFTASTGPARTTGQPTQTTGIVTGNGVCRTAKTRTPQCYRYASDFPPESGWVSLDCLISHGRADMVTVFKDAPDEADNAISAVQLVAAQAGIDPYVLALLCLLGSLLT